MTLLDRFRTQTRHKHPDPAVRLAFVAEIPLDDRELMAAIAREDEDPRVRRAAVAKLMEPAALGARRPRRCRRGVARGDRDAARHRARSVRGRRRGGEPRRRRRASPTADRWRRSPRPRRREIVALRALARVERHARRSDRSRGMRRTRRFAGRRSSAARARRARRDPRGGDEQRVQGHGARGGRRRSRIAASSSRSRRAAEEQGGVEARAQHPARGGGARGTRGRRAPEPAARAVGGAPAAVKAAWRRSVSSERLGCGERRRLAARSSRRALAGSPTPTSAVARESKPEPNADAAARNGAMRAPARELRWRERGGRDVEERRERWQARAVGGARVAAARRGRDQRARRGGAGARLQKLLGRVEPSDRPAPTCRSRPPSARCATCAPRSAPSRRCPPKQDYERSPGG